MRATTSWAMVLNLVVTGAAINAAAQCPPEGPRRHAVMRYYMDWLGSTTCDSATVKSVPISACIEHEYSWDSEVRSWIHSTPTAQGETEELRAAIKGNYVDTSEAGIVLIAAHGSSDGIALEHFWHPADVESVETIYEEDAFYDQFGYDDSFFSVAWEFYLGLAHPIVYFLYLDNPGISARLKVNDPNGLLVLSSCSHFNARQNWRYHTFIGYEEDEYGITACNDLGYMFFRMGCGGGFGSDNTASAAIRGLSSHLEIDPPGSLWTFKCRGCTETDALFQRVGAFDGNAWAVVEHADSKSIELYGFQTSSGFPSNGSEIRAVGELQANGRHLYVEEGIPPYPYYAWVETDSLDRKTWSDLFAASEEPADWDSLVALDGGSPQPPPRSAGVSPSREVFFVTEKGRTAEVNSVRRPETVNSNPYFGAEVGIYSNDYFALEEEWGTLHELGYSRVRAFWGDGSIEDQRAWADSLKSGNLAANAWCANHPGQCVAAPYPEAPVYGLVGEQSTVSGYLELVMYPPVNGPCTIVPTASCADLSAPANLEGDALEDLPIYSVPSYSGSALQNLRATALRYERNDNPHPAGILLLGDWYPWGTSVQPTAALASTKSYLQSIGLPVYELRSSTYGAVIGTRVEDFVNRVNSGVSLIAGVGGGTTSSRWPGGFTPSDDEPYPGQIDTWAWISHCTTPQSAVALLPGCDIGNFPTFSNRLGAAIFADTTKTSVAFAVAHRQGGNDLHHYLWAEMLGLTIADAQVGTPWPRIVWEAKKRAVLQHPFLLDHLRRVASWGTMVRKQSPPAVSAVGDEGSEAGSLTLSTGQGGASPWFGLELAHADHVEAKVFDVAGRFVAKLLSTRLERGSHRVTWNGRNESGDRVAAGVYLVRVQTLGGIAGTTKVIVIR